MKIFASLLFLICFLSPGLSFAQVDKTKKRRIDRSRSEQPSRNSDRAVIGKASDFKQKKDTVITIFPDGSIKKTYPSGAWVHYTDFGLVRYDPITGDTMPIKYTGAQYASPPKPIRGFQNQRESEWKESLDEWLKGHAEQLELQIRFLLGNDEKLWKQYLASEEKNCNNIYEKVDYRGKFIVKMKSVVKIQNK